MSDRHDAADDETDVGSGDPADPGTDATGDGADDDRRLSHDRTFGSGADDVPEMPTSGEVDLDALEDHEPEPKPRVKSETRRGKILKPAVAGLVVGLVAGALLGMVADLTVGIPLRDLLFFAVAGAAAGCGGGMAYGAAHDEELVVEV